ncbi:uncharacterized protein LOC135352219 [Halichondria panicea]|uniref:uncharacterized protein LOC135352219 n=1 Tax=Halichondria panicea TaxID=6063 RepID=UPI00312BB172
MATRFDPPPPYTGEPEPQINESLESCPNGCDTGVLTHGQLKDHLLDCPLQLVECEFASAGCNVKVPRRDLAGHMTESVQHHLLTATLLNLRLTRELHDQKDKQISELQHTIANMDTHLKLLTPSSTNGYICHDIIMSDVKQFLASGNWTSDTFMDQCEAMEFKLVIGIKKLKKESNLTASLAVCRDNKQRVRLGFYFKANLIIKILSHTQERDPFVVSWGSINGRLPSCDKLLPLDELLAKNTPYIKDNRLHFQLYLKTK